MSLLTDHCARCETVRTSIVTSMIDFKQTNNSHACILYLPARMRLLFVQYQWLG